MRLLRLLGHLPFPLLYLASRLVCLWIYRVARYRREVVYDNLLRAFPELSEPERDAIGRLFYRRLADMALEIAKSPHMHTSDFMDRAWVKNPELLLDYSNKFRQSVIILTIHQGNWEWMLHGVSALLKMPVDPVYQPMHNKAAEDFVYNVRKRFGSRPVSLEELGSDILKHRRQPRFLAILADQAPAPHQRQIRVPFFGDNVAFYEGPVAVARITGYPLVFAHCRRKSRGHYIVEFQPLSRDPAQESEEELVARYARMAEQAIRDEPEGWLWSHRRWKHESAE